MSTSKPIKRCDICGRPTTGRLDRRCQADFEGGEYIVNEDGETVPLATDCDGNELKVTARDVLRLMRDAKRR